jgi:hypothetical protein
LPSIFHFIRSRKASEKHETISQLTQRDASASFRRRRGSPSRGKSARVLPLRTSTVSCIAI